MAYVRELWPDLESGKHFRLELGTEPIGEHVLEINGLLKALDCHPTRDMALDGTRVKQPDRLL